MANKRVGGGRAQGRGRSTPRQPLYMKKGGMPSAGRPEPGERKAAPEHGIGKGAGKPSRPRAEKPAYGRGVRPSVDKTPRPRPERKPSPPEAIKGPLKSDVEENEEKVAGINPVLELLRSGGRPLDTLFVDKDKGGRHFEEMISLARRSGVTVKVVPKGALDNLSGGLRHQGVVALVTPKAYSDPAELVARALGKGGLPLLVVLDGIEDPRNLGAIIRTAESVGADGVVIPEHRAAHLSATVAKASAGALEHMPVAKVPNIAGFLNNLKEKGFWIVGLAGEAGEDYTGFDMNVPVAVVLGNEGAGMRPIVKKACDAIVRLPMLGRVSSLNVSVAAGVMLYEILRQRGRQNAI